MYIETIQDSALVQLAQSAEQPHIRNPDPISDPVSPDPALCADIERLVQSGLHLLRDIGFEHLPVRSCPAQSVWEGKGIRITLDARTGRILAAQPTDDT